MFEKRLKQAREAKGISQRELSKKCEIGEKQIWRYENGVSEPTSGHLIRIAQSLGLSSDYLLGLSDDPGVPFSGKEIPPHEAKVISLVLKGDLPSILEAAGRLVQRAHQLAEARPQGKRTSSKRSTGYGLRGIDSETGRIIERWDKSPNSRENEATQKTSRQHLIPHEVPPESDE